ncbi:hypothetical protein BAUCODRAFT_37247 [Baudoinia panamericana UAMH 10762]|uniref:Uncharacterized protein n=1 Tax=Baudoinia panamericana (strain UAMH 10762) TaxID=717646 RepID=M2LHD7_BAUPA|nr:uncharacterized protein BAUCODRAFT_37247 [Baudoinia panamericana UAMH 10762]EMC93557.1 hypothetical protein BAUCODRAFT_37247 [Baudoinia panamericana UAMH 10762]
MLAGMRGCSEAKADCVRETVANTEVTWSVLLLLLDGEERVSTTRPTHLLILTTALR